MKNNRSAHAFLVGMLLIAACFVRAYAQQEDPHWTPVQNGIVPINAEIGGSDRDGLQLPLCWSIHLGGWHPGKVFQKRCLIMYGGREFDASGPYVVYVGRIRWRQGPSLTYGPYGPVAGALEAGVMRPLCQAKLTALGEFRGTYPGKIVDGKCNVGWGNKEWQVSDYMVGFDSTALEPVWFRNKIYRIVSVKSGLGIQTKDPARTAGIGLQQRADTKTIDQHWRIIWKGAGYYQIRAFLGTVCLDSGGASATANGPLKLATCADVNSQMWSFVDYEPRQQIISSKDTKRVLHVDLGRTDDGADIYLWERNNGPFQLWRFETVVTPASFEFQCKESLRDTVAWNRAGSKNWSDANLDSLCARTANPDATIYCFTEFIKQKDNWSDAIQACKAK